MMCCCEKLKQDSQKEKIISNNIKNLGLLVSRAIYKNNAIITMHLCIGNGSSRFSLDKPLILYHKRPLNGIENQVFDDFSSDDIPIQYLSDVSEILLNPPSPCDITNQGDIINELAMEKCQGEFLSLLPEEFQTKKPGRCPPNKCLKVPYGHYVLLHFGKGGNGAVVTTCIVAARYTEDALNDTPFYMIVLHFNEKFNLLVADGFYFQAASTFQVKDYLNPTIPLYHHLFTKSEAQEILQNDLPQKMEENGVYSLSTLLHRANQIRYMH